MALTNSTVREATIRWTEDSFFQDLLWGGEEQDTFTVNANQDPWAGPLAVDLITDLDLLVDERKKTNFLFANNSYWG